jgi:hypothetical protein
LLWFWFGSDDEDAARAPDDARHVHRRRLSSCTSLAQPKVMLYDKAQRAEIIAAYGTFFDAQHSKDDSVFASALQVLSNALQMRRFHDEFLRKNDTSAGNSYHAPNYLHSNT